MYTGYNGLVFNLIILFLSGQSTGSLISPSFSNLARIIAQMEPHSSSSFSSELSRRPARHTVSDTMLYEEDEDEDGQVIMQRMRSGSLDGDNRRSIMLGHGPDTSEDEAGYVVCLLLS